MLVAQRVDEGLHDPVGVAELGGQVGPLQTGVDIGGHLAQHGVGEASSPLGGQRDRLADRGVGRRAEVRQLERAEAQHPADLVVGGPEGVAVDQVVEGPAHPGGAVGDRGDEVPVAGGEA